MILLARIGITSVTMGLIIMLFGLIFPSDRNDTFDKKERFWSKVLFIGLICFFVPLAGYGSWLLIKVTIILFRAIARWFVYIWTSENVTSIWIL